MGGIAGAFCPLASHILYIIFVTVYGGIISLIHCTVLIPIVCVLQSLRKEVMEDVIELCSREPTSHEVLVATQCHLRRAQDDEDDQMDNDDRERWVKADLRSNHPSCSCYSNTYKYVSTYVLSYGVCCGHSVGAGCARWREWLTHTR